MEEGEKIGELLRSDMADGAVSFLLETISSLIAQEVFMLRSLRRDLEYIKSKLEIIQSLLKDADRRKESSNSQTKKTWIKRVREVSYDIEDLIDAFMYHTDKQEDRGGVKGFLQNAIYFPRNIVVSHRIATRLKEIKATLHDISEEGKQLPNEGSSSSTNDAELKNRPFDAESSHFAMEEDLVGIAENRNKLIGWLKDEEPHLLVFSVVGMGGLGKTTLVTKVYNSPDVKQHFHCYAWLSISQSYKIEEVLQRMIKEFYNSLKEDLPDNIGQMDYRQLVGMLRNYLQDKRYVIVLDDVWNRQAWVNISVAIPNNQCGSRVMLTTRSKTLGVENDVFHLRPLNHSDAWALFCGKAFWNNPNKSCPEELEPVARAIVDRCEGLPLAIVAIGGMMSLKERRELEWKKVEDSLSWEIRNNPELERMKHILLLSYNDLPYHLKNCFLYCSVFPEDNVFSQIYLVTLWVAEGFVEQIRGQTMEEVAEGYIKELIHRNMLQLATMDTFYDVKSFRLHDLMRELALEMAEEENFCMVYNGGEPRQGSKARRLSIQISGGVIPRSASHCRLRSFFVFGKDMILSSSLNRITSTCRQLRVLDLANASNIDKVPDGLVNLFNLRYLSLKNTNVRKLPKSLGKLRNLQTLNISNTSIQKLPAGIKKLKNLRHLHMFCLTGDEHGYNHVKATQAPSEICELKCLQTLMGLEANAKIVRQAGNFTQLRRLEITNVRKENEKELFSSIQKMERLFLLYVTGASDREALQLGQLSSPPQQLKYISLTCHLEKVPQWIGSLKNLLYLSLKCSQLQEDPLPSIASLPNLMELRLIQAYEGQQLCYLTGCFPKLKILYLQKLKHLSHVRIEQGAMPSIERILLFDCPELKIIPQGMEHLSSLQALYLREMPEEFIEKLKGDASEDQRIVNHIPTIRNVFVREGKLIYENLSKLKGVAKKEFHKVSSIEKDASTQRKLKHV